MIVKYSNKSCFSRQLFERDSQPDRLPQLRDSNSSPAPVQQQPAYSPARVQSQNTYVSSQPSSPPQGALSYARSTSAGPSFKDHNQQQYPPTDAASSRSMPPHQPSYNRSAPTNYAPQPNYVEMENSRKRKREYDREEEDAWHRNVSRKIDDERKKVDLDEEQHYQSNKDLYALFNDLQGISAE